MANEIQVLKQTELLGQQLTVYGTMEQPLFLAKDVAEWIEHTDTSTMMRCVDSDERILMTNPNNVCGGQSAWFLTEDGLYEVLMQSRKPIAKQFKKGVKNILREIRTSGGYLATSDTDTSEEILAKAVLVAQKTIERREQRIRQLEQATEQQTLTIKEQAKTIDTLNQKVSYLDHILQSKSTVATSQIAQDYGMSAKKFNKLLHELKIQHKVSGQWILRYPHIDKGYVHSETINIQVSVNGTEVTKAVMHTKWTQSGRLFLYEKLKKNNVLPLIER